MKKSNFIKCEGCFEWFFQNNNNNNNYYYYKSGVVKAYVTDEFF